MSKKIVKIENGPNLEQKVEHIMIGKIQLLVAIILFIVPVIGFFFKIEMDVNLIKENHMTHIENIEKSIEKQDANFQQKYLELRQQDSDTLKVLGEYNSKLDVLIGKTEK